MDNVVIHPRVHEQHPELDDSDVLDAWRACLRSVPRLDKNPNEYIAIGSDSHGRLVEMIARRTADGTWIVFHAFTPPTRKALYELGMTGRK